MVRDTLLITGGIATTAIPVEGYSVDSLIGVTDGGQLPITDAVPIAIVISLIILVYVHTQRAFGLGKPRATASTMASSGKLA